MKNKEILGRFHDLNIWQRGDERAPHKPLLVLYAIGRLMGGDKQLAYIDIKEDLRNLLKEFGAPRKNYRPQDPFWRLRNEKERVWDIPNEYMIGETLRSNRKSTGDAIIKDLEQYGVGGFIEPIARKFEKNHRLAYEVAMNILDSHFPITYHEDIFQAVGISYPTQIRFYTTETEAETKTTRPRDPRFREKILNAYEYKCAVCGFQVRLRDNLVALEAAHIKWHRAEGPDIESNGLALCSLHHKLFDRGVFRLSLDWEILVSNRANGSSGFDEWLMRFHSEPINFPQSRAYYPKAEFIEWHAEQVFKGDYREL